MGSGGGPGQGHPEQSRSCPHLCCGSHTHVLNTSQGISPSCLSCSGLLPSLSPAHGMRPPDTWLGPIPTHHQAPAPPPWSSAPPGPHHLTSTAPHSVLRWTGWGKRPLPSEPSLAGPHITLTPRSALPVRQELAAVGLLRRARASLTPSSQPQSCCLLQALTIVTHWPSPLAFPPYSARGSERSGNVTLLLKLLPT